MCLTLDTRFLSATIECIFRTFYFELIFEIEAEAERLFVVNTIELRQYYLFSSPNIQFNPLRPKKESLTLPPANRLIQIVQKHSSNFFLPTTTKKWTNWHF
jgi:hypothetical protein